MGKQSRKKRTVKLSATAKGRIVEQIAAWMYCSPRTIVETNVHYPTPGGDRKREIDVLLTRYVVGYPTHVAIECQNERGYRCRENRCICWQTARSPTFSWAEYLYFSEWIYAGSS